MGLNTGGSHTSLDTRANGAAVTLERKTKRAKIAVVIKANIFVIGS